MNTKKITESEIAELKVSSLPSRPTAPGALGGRGYTSSQMKAAFDKLPLFIIQRFNALMDDIVADDEGSLAAAIPTGIYEGHTLLGLFLDIVNGSLAEYLTVGEVPLAEYCEAADALMKKHTEDIEALFVHVADSIIDGGHPSERDTDGAFAV